MAVGSSSTCMFSGGPADTIEHVVPKWLQRRFDLWNETLVLPNGTGSPYRQVTVPVTAEHNNAFAAIEGRVSRGVLSPDEVFLWALKLHIGLIYRDSRLKMDQRDPTSGVLLELKRFASEIQLFRELYGLWRAGIRTKPCPFGTVIVLPASHFLDRFDFFHCMTTGVVGVRIGQEFLLVFLWDQGDASRSNILTILKEHHLATIEKAAPEDRDASAYLALHAWACESAYHTWRRRRPIDYVETENGLTLGKRVKTGIQRGVEEATYRRVCASFGLSLEEFGGETHNRYGQLRLPGRRSAEKGLGGDAAHAATGVPGAEEKRPLEGVTTTRDTP